MFLLYDLIRIVDLQVKLIHEQIGTGLLTGDITGHLAGRLYWPILLANFTGNLIRRIQFARLQSDINPTAFVSGSFESEFSQVVFDYVASKLLTRSFKVC